MRRHVKAAIPGTAAVGAATSDMVTSGMLTGLAANARGMGAGMASVTIVRNAIVTGRMANASSGASATRRRIRIHPLPSSRR